MKSSRQRFAEFREKVRKGLLTGDRLREPGAKYEEPPSMGGRHVGPSYEKHEFKFSRRRLLGEYRLLLRGYYGSIATLLAVVVVQSLTTLTPPVVLKLLIDNVFVGKPLPLLGLNRQSSLAQWLNGPAVHGLEFLVLALLVVEIVGITASWMRLLATQRLNYRLAGTLRQRLLEHLATLPLAQLADYRTGGIISRIMADSDQVVGGIQNAIINPVVSLLRMAIILVILTATDWKLFVAAVILIPPIIVIHFFIFRRLRPLWRNIQDERSILSARVSDIFSGIRVVRGFRRERSEQKEFAARQHTMIRKQYYTSVLGRLLATGWGIFVPAITILILWYGGQQVLNHKLLTGDLVMFVSYSIMLLGPITQMIESLQALQQNMGALDRVTDVLSQPSDMPDKPNALALHHPAGHLSLGNISFGYKADQNVLHELSLDIPPGATLAIVGPSGSGKTTLVNLIARFFDVQSGAILLDGCDIRDIRRDDYRRLFGMVLQDVYLFDGTVADNIAFGRRQATRHDIIAAARLANAHEFIMELENGYDTPIGERGMKLSGGQKQRLSIARAMLANPHILILDEATSSLDTQSERLIQKSLQELMRGRTTIAIAHRLSTIISADRIVVLVDGRIVEQGTHEELLEAGGMYHAMFTQQFDSHRDPTLERIEWEKV